MNLDALVNATEAAAGIPDVCRHLIGMWKYQGKLKPKGTRGRSPLYRYGDVLKVEQQTRRSGYSHRERCKTCEEEALRRLEQSAGQKVA